MEHLACPRSRIYRAEGSQIVNNTRTEPVDAGLLVELGVADTQETFKDERL